MSVGVMSLVFKAEMTDLSYEKDGEKRNAKASTVKLMLLAYADHANDEGEGAYPGYDKLEIKTALSRQGIADTLEAIKQNNFMTFEGVSKWGTNSYKINKSALEVLVKPLDSGESSHLTQASQATRLKPSVKPKKQPSLKDAPTPKPPPPPEILTFRETTNRYPNKLLWGDVVASIQKMAVRLLRPVTRDDLIPFYKFWLARAYNPLGLGWLEWAETGEMPKNATWKPQKFDEPKAFDGIRKFLAGQPENEVINAVAD